VDGRLRLDVPDEVLIFRQGAVREQIIRLEWIVEAYFSAFMVDAAEQPFCAASAAQAMLAFCQAAADVIGWKLAGAQLMGAGVGPLGHELSLSRRSTWKPLRHANKTTRTPRGRVEAMTTDDRFVLEDG